MESSVQPSSFEFQRKRPLGPENDGATKRRKHRPSSGKIATRPIISGELFWGRLFIKSLYLSEKDKDTFCIHFKETSATQPKPLCDDTRLESVEDLKYYGTRLRAIEALLASYQFSPRRHRREWRLELRYGTSTSVVETDGVFRSPSTGSMVTFVDLAQMAERRAKHPVALLPEKRKEEPTVRERRAKEYLRIKPKKVEEDAQIALIKAAMVQEMFRNGYREPRGAWARVIAVGTGMIYMYRSWIPKRFVETFEVNHKFAIEYCSISLSKKREVIGQLDCLLRERSPPMAQPGAAAAAKHEKL